MIERKYRQSDCFSENPEHSGLNLGMAILSEQFVLSEKLAGHELLIWIGVVRWFSSLLLFRNFHSFIFRCAAPLGK